MKCPKCGHDQKDSNIECVRCGVIFSKVQPSTPSELSDQKSKKQIREIRYDHGTFKILMAEFKMLSTFAEVRTTHRSPLPPFVPSLLLSKLQGSINFCLTL